jgi:lysophospholipase L1-like esterase
MMRSIEAIRVAILVTLAGTAAACSNDSDSPTSPSPGGGGGSAGVVYSALGASDTMGYGSSVECFPFSPCPNGMGYVQLLERRLRETGPVTLYNRGVPGAILGPTIEEVGRRVGRTFPGNILTNQSPFTHQDSTVVTVFAGPNDANAIGQVIEAQLAGDDPRAFIDQQVRLWADDYAAVLRQIRQRAPGTRIVLINLPNLAAMPYFAARSTFQKSIMQRIAVSMNDHVNALRAANVHVVDVMCDPRVLEPSSFSGDGYHPGDRGYALLAELTYPAMVNASHPAPAGDCGQRHVFPPY